MLTERSALFPMACRRCISGQNHDTSDMPFWSYAAGQWRNSEKQTTHQARVDAAKFTAQGSSGFMIFAVLPCFLYSLSDKDAHPTVFNFFALFGPSACICLCALSPPWKGVVQWLVI